MAYFEFPHTRNYEGDLGYIIKKLMELTDKYNTFFEYNSITFADPIQWDITRQYAAYTIVFDYDSGYAMISKQPVPAGILLSNSDYWSLVGPLIVDADARLSIQKILSFIANIYETGTTATAVRNPGDYIIANGDLYVATSLINIGETYTNGYNVNKTTVENMILDRFPIGTADISDDAVTTNKIIDDAITTPKINDGAVTTAKIADDAVTTAKILDDAVTNDKLADNSVTSDKIADGSILKQDMAPDKYLFIGDSFNTDLHYGWGKKIATKLGLTYQTDYYNIGTPGGGMANGLILTDVQSLAGGMTADEKKSITKIAMIFGANDWSATESSIGTGLQNLESFLVSTFPNADIYLIAAQWGYLNNTYRQGLLAAYNAYASYSTKIKFIDKAFILMLDPYFVEADMVHPTDACTTNMASMVINILNGGNAWTKYYTGLNAVVDTTAFGGNGSFTINGDITPAGTHVYRNTKDSVQWYNTPITIANAGTQIGTISGVNNFFQRHAEIPMIFFCWYLDSGNNNQYGLFKGRLIIEKHSDNDAYWDVYVTSESFLDGSYNIKVKGLYINFNALLDYCET